MSAVRAAQVAPDDAVAVRLPARTDTVDRYLETVYCIAAEGETVRPSRIADWLAVSAPTVSVALQRLARDGWIEVAADRSVTLTDAGAAAAADIVRRHRLLERWLTDVLHFDWAQADIEAHSLAGGVSDDVLARLDASMNHPATCPHGNAIPGRTPPYGDLIALPDLEPEVVATVQRISEVAEQEAPQLLRQLADQEVSTGTLVRLSHAGGGPGTVAVCVGSRTISLSTATARRIWVEVLQEPATT